MTCLSAQQAALQAYMLTPAAEQGIVQHIATTRRASSKVRLDVYAEAYRLRLQEALSTDFEALHGLLGDTQFEQLCLKYIASLPAEHWSTMCLELHESVRCLEFEWNVHAIWAALKEGKEPEAPAQDKVRPWLIWRKNLTSYFRPLSPQEAWGLDVIRNGSNFGVLCE